MEFWLLTTIENRGVLAGLTTKKKLWSFGWSHHNIILWSFSCLTAIENYRVLVGLAAIENYRVLVGLGAIENYRVLVGLTAIENYRV